MKNNLEEIQIGDYLEVITDYHSGGSYETLKEKTKILYDPDYAVMIRTLNFERDDFDEDLIYCDKASYDFLEYSHVEENDILMNKIANPGSVYIMPKVDYRVTCGMNLFLLRFKDVDQKYMYYLMKNYEDYIKSKAHGTTTKTITKDDVRELSFYAHSIPEQKKIGDFLSTIDLAIREGKAIQKKLLRLLDSIYEHYFLQMDFHNSDDRPYKSSGGKMKWSEELGYEIPESWKVQTLLKNDYTSIIQPGVEWFYQKEYIATGEVQGNDIGTGSTIEYESRENRANMQPSLYSIWFAKMKKSRKQLYLTKEHMELIENAILSTGFCGIQCDEMCFEYFSAFINHRSFEIIKDTLSHGATMEGVNNDDLGMIYIAIPDYDLIKLFHKNTQGIIEMFNRIAVTNKKYDRIKKELMPLIFNGQVTLGK